MIKDNIFDKQYGTVSEKFRPLPLIYKIFRKFEVNRLDKVSEFIQNNRFNVLELGCGDGRFLYKNRQKWKRITGVDIVGSLLKKAKNRKYGVVANFINEDFGIRKMPFKEDSFDLVISISTMQYIYNLDLLFSEIYRVLKKNGILIFEIPNIAVFWRRFQLLLGKMPITSQFGGYFDSGVIHYFTQKEVISFLNFHKFKVKKVNCSGILSNLRSIYPSLFGADLIFICRK